MTNDNDLTWTQKEEKVVFKTRVFDVTERTCVSPDGREGVYIVNNAPQWCIVIPETQDCFLMVRQWRHGEGKISTEFPGGVLEPGEDPAVGAARELQEETGAKAGELLHLGTLNPNPALFSNHVHVFLAKNLEFTDVQNLDEDEYVKYMKVPKSEVIKNMGKGEYFHALMAMALGLYLANK